MNELLSFACRGVAIDFFGQGWIEIFQNGSHCVFGHLPRIFVEILFSTEYKDAHHLWWDAGDQFFDNDVLDRVWGEVSFKIFEMDQRVV